MSVRTHHKGHFMPPADYRHRVQPVRPSLGSTVTTCLVVLFTLVVLLWAGLEFASAFAAWEVGA